MRLNRGPIELQIPPRVECPTALAELRSSRPVEYTQNFQAVLGRAYKPTFYAFTGLVGI